MGCEPGLRERGTRGCDWNSKEPAETRQGKRETGNPQGRWRETRARPSVSQGERRVWKRGQGQKDGGDCRQGRAGQRAGGRESRKVREIHRQWRMRAGKWAPMLDPETPVSQRGSCRLKRRGERQGFWR